MPYLVNGKIDRQTLLRRYDDISSKMKTKIVFAPFAMYSQNNVTASAASRETKIDLTGVSENLTETAKCLFETVAAVLGSSLRSHVSMDANFFSLGGNSLNAIYTISKLADQGYSIRTYLCIARRLRATTVQCFQFRVLRIIYLRCCCSFRSRR